MRRIPAWKMLAGLFLLAAVCSCGRQGDPGLPGGSSADFVAVAVEGTGCQLYGNRRQEHSLWG
jgi:hypothetical protein